MDPSQPFPLAPPVRVDPTAIERSLAQLWAQTDQVPTRAGGTSVVRACTLNFAVVLSSEDQAAAVADIVAGVTLRHPSRIFLLVADRGAVVESLQASVSALCHLPAPGQPHICCEQIVIEAGGRAVDRLAHLLLALLVPDLPVIVWWRGRPPFGTPLFSGLNAIADRVLIDSLRFAANRADVEQMATLVHESEPFALADLAWTRLTPWRVLLAQCFDTPQRADALAQLDRVRLTVGGTALTTEALLFLGWLASRLGWRATAGQAEGSRVQYTLAGRGTVRADIEWTGDADGGALRSVELSASGAASVRCAVASGAEPRVHVNIALPNLTPLERVVPLGRDEPAALLGDELDIAAHDRVYEAALAMVRQFTTVLPGP